jgi:hypothetical protein
MHRHQTTTMSSTNAETAVETAVVGKTGNGSLLMLRGHLLPRFGGARGTWELALLSTALNHMYVGLEDLRHHIRENQYTQNVFQANKCRKCHTLSKDVTSSLLAGRGKLVQQVLEWVLPMVVTISIIPRTISPIPYRSKTKSVTQYRTPINPPLQRPRRRNRPRLRRRRQQHRHQLRQQRLRRANPRLRARIHPRRENSHSQSRRRLNRRSHLSGQKRHRSPGRPRHRHCQRRLDALLRLQRPRRPVRR